MSNTPEISDWVSDWLNQKFITMKGFTECNRDEVVEELRQAKCLTSHDKKILFELANRHGITKMLDYFIEDGLDINMKEAFSYTDGSKLEQSYVLISKNWDTLSILLA